MNTVASTRSRRRFEMLLAAFISVVMLVVLIPHSFAAPWADDDLTVFDSFEGNDLADEWQSHIGEWIVEEGSLRPVGNENDARERLITRSDVKLGLSYMVTATFDILPEGTFTPWNGLAANVQPDPSGGLQMYLLRMRPNPNVNDDRRLWYQLLYVSGHGTPNMSLQVLRQGYLWIDASTTIEATIASVQNSSELSVTVTGANGASASNPSPIYKPEGAQLFGGTAGIYSLAGYAQFHSFEVGSTQGDDLTVFDSFEGNDLADEWQSHIGEWIVEEGSLRPVGNENDARERLITRSDVKLGLSYMVTATFDILPEGTFTPWNGLAANVQPDPSGGLQMYLLRMRPNPNVNDDRRLWYQLLYVSGHGTPNMSLQVLRQGYLWIDASTTIEATIASVQNSSELSVTVTGANGASASNPSPIYKPEGAQLFGGTAGIYSLAGYAQFHSFEVGSTQSDAGPVVPVPEPQCEPIGPALELPGTAMEVREVSDVGLTWGGHPVTQAITADDQRQYVVYYNEERKVTVASRLHGSSDWSYVTLDSSVRWDTHNALTASVDSSGHLHVSGNMHNNPLNYWRTETAGDISSLVRVFPMVDSTRESNVTYPVFIATEDGQLVFRYRDGYSGSGVDVYNGYDVNTRTWHPLLTTPLLDGEGIRNAYAQSPVAGPDGNFHMVWVWRENADAATNHDIYYARSSDLVDWRSSAGDPITLPIRDGDADLVADVPMLRGLLNGAQRIGFDPSGGVLVAYSHYDSNFDQQIYVARPDGSGGWERSQVTQWSGRAQYLGGGSLVSAITVRSIGTGPDGSVHLTFTCGIDGQARVAVLDPQTLAPIGEAPAPAELPDGFIEPTSDHPDAMVRTARLKNADGTVSVLRWETMPANQDQPYDPGTYLESSVLQVYLLGPADDEPLDGAPPARGVLSHDNGHSNGLRGGSFNVTVDLWSGENARKVVLYENDVMVAERELSHASPAAQRAVFPITGRENDEYSYRAELINFAGTTSTDSMTVIVADADPGKPALSHNNWDEDGEYTVTANMWWGTNATSYILYENGQQIASGDLTDATPNAQSVSIDISGRPAGVYEYEVDFTNDVATTRSESVTVRVR